MKLLEGKTALITGASRGIGKAVALAFAKQGANIAFTDLRYDENAQATEKEIEACGVKAKMYASNAADFAQTAATVEEIAKEFGRIDILVNNAGITKDTLLMRMTEEQWDAVINVNLKSVFNFTKAVSAIMLKQKSGSIISMSSVVGVRVAACAWLAAGAELRERCSILLPLPVLSVLPRVWPKNWDPEISGPMPLLRDLSLQI